MALSLRKPSRKTRADLLEVARSWMGTPFHHQQRKRGVGVDCAGLLVEVARECGWEIQDDPRKDYSRFPVVGKPLFNMVAGQSVQIPPEQVQVGSIYLFWVRRATVPQHMGLCSGDNKIIHAWYEAKRVCEITLDPYWTQRIFATFDFEGVR